MGDGAVDKDSAFSFEVTSESGFPTVTNEKTTKSRTPRKRAPKKKYDETKGTIAGFGTGVWGALGHGAVKLAEVKENSALEPTGRMMQLQAPAAGKRIANILERTPLINFLASVMGTGGIIGDIQALVMPPLLVYLVSSKPELRESPIAQTVIMATMVPIAKEIIQAQSEQAQSASVFDEIDDETSSVIGEMMEAIFGPREEN